MLRSFLALALLCGCPLVPAMAQQPSGLQQALQSVAPAPQQAESVLPVQQSTPSGTHLLQDLPPLPKRTTIQPPPAAVVADILRIRAAQGDSNPESDADFSEALRRVASEESAKRPALPAESSPLPTPPTATVNPYFVPPGTIGLPAVGVTPLVTSLRQAARQLDSVAADYEERNEYELAEKTRGIATSLRSQARQLQSPSEPTVKTY